MTQCTRQVLALCLASAFAPPATAREPAEHEARDAYEKGLAHYDRNEYDQAIVWFKQAYERKRAPLLLFNLAQAYRLNKDYARAVQTYRAYLRLLPDAPNRADATALMNESSARLSDEAAARPPPPPPARRVDLAPTSPMSPPVDATGDARRARAEIIAGSVVAAVGLVGVATGAYFAARRGDDFDRLAGLRGGNGVWDDAAQTLYDDGRSAAITANVLFSVGAALVATGSVLALVGIHGRSRARAVSLAPLGRGAVGGWSCAF